MIGITAFGEASYDSVRHHLGHGDRPVGSRRYSGGGAPYPGRRGVDPGALYRDCRP